MKKQYGCNKTKQYKTAEKHDLTVKINYVNMNSVLRMPGQSAPDFNTDKNKFAKFQLNAPSF